MRVSWRIRVSANSVILISTVRKCNFAHITCICTTYTHIRALNLRSCNALRADVIAAPCRNRVNSFRVGWIPHFSTYSLLKGEMREREIFYFFLCSLCSIIGCYNDTDNPLSEPGSFDTTPIHTLPLYDRSIRSKLERDISTHYLAALATLVCYSNACKLCDQRHEHQWTMLFCIFL